MNILVTGNLGYVGSVLTPHLRRTFPAARIVGLDTAFFASCLSVEPPPSSSVDEQRYGDVRDGTDLTGIDAVVQLAAVSNDPIGNTFAAATAEINHDSTIALARAAKAAGARSFVFASSCSVYGAAADGAPRREGDGLDPITPYARSKVDSERDLEGLAGDGMTVTCLRFATACGMSDRLRLDLVLNDFVACAMAAGKITVLSDGSPWRPLIDVADMARAIEWAIGRQPANGGAYLAVNVGRDDWNFQVRELADAVARAVPGTSVHINPSASPDKRSYRVDFSLYRRLAPAHQPQCELDQSIARIAEGLRRVGFADADFRNSDFIRLNILRKLIAAGKIDQQLRQLAPVAKRAAG